jgi:hypothetical protein
MVYKDKNLAKFTAFATQRCTALLMVLEKLLSALFAIRIHNVQMNVLYAKSGYVQNAQN